MEAKDKLLTVELFAGGLKEFKDIMTDQLVDKDSGKIKKELLPESHSPDPGTPCKETQALSDEDLDEIIDEVYKQTINQ